MTPQEVYYKEGSEMEVFQTIRNPKLKNVLKTNYRFKNLWKYVTNEQDIIDLTYFFMAKARQWRGCIGESMAQDALDFIHANRDKKIHELGEIYAK